MTLAILSTASIAVAFISGMIALFAPCCISFLLPTYLGQVLNTRLKTVLATGIFSLGIATVMLPISLGFKLIVSLFNEYHTQVYVLGGALMIFTGFLLLGKIKLPMLQLKLPALTTDKISYGSVYLLGITSGLASSCCAPVLMAAITVVSLSPTFLMALIVGIGYVVGMVFPLFLAALLMQTEFLSSWRNFLIKEIKGVPVGDWLGGLVMIIFGIGVIYLALTGQVIMPEQGQAVAVRIAALGASFNRFFIANRYFDAVFIFGIVGLAVWIFRTIKKELKD